jgi:glutamate dehydrogenase
LNRLVPRRASGALAKTFLALVGENPVTRAFIDQAAQDAAPDDLPEVSTALQAEALADFLTYALAHKGKGPALRLLPLEESGLDRLEIVQPDAPFLVDSVMGELGEHGLSARAMIHPILDLPAGKGTRPVSMIQVVLDRVGADRESALLKGLKATLADVHSAVADFADMRALMESAIAELAAAPPGKDREEQVAFLRWLADERFVYLGSRVYAYPRTPEGGYAPDEPVYGPGDGLGVLRDPDRTVLRRSSEPAVLAARLQRRLADPPLRVAKANLKSRVHRRAYMDYVGVQRYGEDGKPCGEIRFVGLFTAEAYDEPARDVPLISAKVARVLERARAPEGGHNDKRL